MLAMILFEVGQTEDGAERRPRRRRPVTARRLRDELRNVSRRCRSPVPGAPRPLGRGRQRPRQCRVAGVDPDRRHPTRRRERAAGRSSRTCRGGCDDLAERLRRHPSDPFSDAIIDAALVDVHLAAKQWDKASTSRRCALSPKPGRWLRDFVARFTAGLVIGTVERTLDKLARQEAVDVDDDPPRSRSPDRCGPR